VAYSDGHGLDGFVVEGRAYVLKCSEVYQAHLKMPNSRPPGRVA
jgi:hypothetical protein